METNLKQILLERNLTPNTVADEAGISHSAMRALMKGRCEPKLSTARAISEVLGASFYDLWPPDELKKYKSGARAAFSGVGYRLYNYLQYPFVLIVTFLMIRYSSGYSTHPGVHVAIATCLIDVLTLRIIKRWNLFNVGSAVILNVFGAYIILRGGDPLELKVAGWYVLGGLLIAFTNMSRRDGVV